MNHVSMRVVTTCCVAGLALLLAMLAPRATRFLHGSQTIVPLRPDPSTVRYPRDAEEFNRLYEEVKNWGRWGADDQLGAANLITADKRKAALALVHTGELLSLSRPLVTTTSPEAAFADNGAPFEHTMAADLMTDTYKVDYHSFLHSHLDALCHFSYRGKAYNGYPKTEVNTSRGCMQLGVENLRSGVVTRGVLIDIPRLRNVPWLEPGSAVFTEDLEAWERLAGVTIGPGDAIFLRTGRWMRWEKLGPWQLSLGEAGLHASAAPWLKLRGVSVIGSDGGLEVLPSPVAGEGMPMHVLSLTALGIVLLDNQDLDALAETAARLHRWEFMVSFAPLVVNGGTGSPVNAIAMF